MTKERKSLAQMSELELDDWLRHHQSVLEDFIWYVKSKQLSPNDEQYQDFVQEVNDFTNGLKEIWQLVKDAGNDGEL